MKSVFSLWFRSHFSWNWLYMFPLFPNNIRLWFGLWSFQLCQINLRHLYSRLFLHFHQLFFFCFVLFLCKATEPSHHPCVYSPSRTFHQVHKAFSHHQVSVPCLFCLVMSFASLHLPQMIYRRRKICYSLLFPFFLTPLSSPFPPSFSSTMEKPL